jgi:hypothetical protein
MKVSWKILQQTAMQTINNGGSWAYLFICVRERERERVSMIVCVSESEWMCEHEHEHERHSAGVSEWESVSERESAYKYGN